MFNEDDVEVLSLDVPQKVPQTGQEPRETPLGEAEWQVSAVFIRLTDAHATFPVDPKDVQDEISRKIIDGVYKVIAAGRKLNPVEIKEFSGVSQTEIDARINGYRPDWVRSMQTHVERIQFEAFRRREQDALRIGFIAMATSPWRDVEVTHAKTVQSVSAIQMGGVGGMEDEAGTIWDELPNQSDDEMTPLPFPWWWVNAQTQGGMRRNKKYTFAGHPGAGKTSALFVTIHNLVMVKHKRWVHFPFDGGSVNEQLLKFAVVHWAYLLIQQGIPLICQAKGLLNGSVIGIDKNYCYTNPTVLYKLLRARKNGAPFNSLGVSFPPGALDLFEQVCVDMRNLQTGRGPGLLTMVKPKSVGGEVYRVVQRLRNIQYGGDGLDGWSLDHMGMPNNEFSEEFQRINRNTRVLTAYSDMEGPPCILISQLSSEGIKAAFNGKDVNPHLKYNNTLFENSDLVALFAPAGIYIKIVDQKNRDGEGGPDVQHLLRIHPPSRYIWDEDEQPNSSSTIRTRLQAKRGHNGKRDEEEQDGHLEED